MRYFLDTAFDNDGHKLLTLALVPADRSLHNLYLISNDLFCEDEWVHATYLAAVAAPMPPQTHRFHVDPHFIGNALAAYLWGDPEPVILSTWLDSIGHFCDAWQRGNGPELNLSRMTFHTTSIDPYPSKLKDAVRYHSVWDALSLREALEAA